MKKKIRLSYSLLNLWSQGKTDQAVFTYFHKNPQKTPQIVAGSLFHKKMSEHILKNKSFPDWFSHINLTSPTPDEEVIVSYNEIFNLKSLFDCRDGKDLFEFKTGVSDSLEYANEFQIPFYFLIAEIKEIELDRAFIIHYNQYIKKSDYTLVWNSKRLIDKARNYIDSLGPDIYEFFLKQGLI